MTMQQTFERTTFTINRALEFFSEKELTMQIGHPRHMWPIALIKELIDNALDACEVEAKYAPSITITIDADAVTVADNGPGLPLTTLQKSLDYMVRVSDKAYYVSPTRGQLGNALKCVWAAPFVVSGGTSGRVTVAAHGHQHTIDVQLDQIAGCPTITMESEPYDVKRGTIITMHWPRIASYLFGDEDGYSYKPTILDIVAHYAAFNPDLTIVVINKVTEKTYGYKRSSTISPRWSPNRPTSPHWYPCDRFRGLLAAELSAARDTGKTSTIREFVAKFAGLKGSAQQKAVTDAVGLTGASLSTLMNGNGIDSARAMMLLAAMREQSRPIKPALLGGVGKVHLIHHLVQDCAIEPNSAQYRKFEGVAYGVPYTLEMAFGIFTEAYQGCPAMIIVGANWSPVLTRTPIYTLSEALSTARVDTNDPVVVVVHLTCPRVETTDRGKGTIILYGDMDEQLAKGIQSMTKAWTAAKRQADKAGRLHQRQLDELRRDQKRKELSITAAARMVVTDAYNAASDNGRYPAAARQIMYQVRPRVKNLTGGRFWKNSSSFTQEFLPDFMDDDPELTAEWDVVWDDRGHFTEPHTKRQIGVGGIAVRRYISSWSGDLDEQLDAIKLPTECPTSGPAHRYQAVLFLEKEGFNELLYASGILEKYDLGLMSTKGMSVTAARKLVDRFSGQGIPTLVAHDFDKSGFSIISTLSKDTRRYTFTNRPLVTDIGMRLTDVQAMRLESEPVDYEDKIDPRLNLRENGATEDECAFLVRGHHYNGAWFGERVELNAMTSPQLLAWLEQKLNDHGITKVIPDGKVLVKAYRRMRRIALLQKAIDDAKEALPDDIDVPDDLHNRLQAALDPEQDGDDALSWDEALTQLVHDELSVAEGNDD